jgi:hypothetical protein
MMARVQTKILKAKKRLMTICHKRMETHFLIQGHHPTKGRNLKPMLLGNADEWIMTCVYSIGFVSLSHSDSKDLMSRDDYDLHSEKLDKYYSAGTWHGQSAAGAVYILATLLECVDNDFLW